MCLARLPLASRAVRGSAVRGLLAALFAVFFSLSFPIRDAFATYATDAFGTAIYGPVTVEWEGEEHTEVGYVAPNRFDAAAYAIGYTKTEIQNWGSAEGGLDNLAIRGKLSNASTGGAFYELAMSFIEPSADDWVPTDAGPTPGFWAWAYTIYGEGNLWYCSDLTESQKESARAVVERIVNGGSGAGSSDGFYIFQLHGVRKKANGSTPSRHVYIAETFGIDSDGHGFATGSTSEGYLTWTEGDTRLRVAMDPFTYNNLVQSVEDIGFEETYTYLFAGSDGYTQVLFSSFPIVWNSDGNNYYIRNDTNVEQRVFRWNSNNTKTYNVGGSDFACMFIDSNSWKSYTLRPGQTVDDSYFGYLEPFWCTTGEDFLPDHEVGEPEGDWPEPDTPVTPDPPSPDPPSPVGPTAPTLPKPTDPTQPVNVTVTVATPVDDILDALNKIIQELENHCVHLQNKMVECSKYIGEYLGQVRDSILDAFDTNADFNSRLHDDLMNYLEELFGWMRDNLNFDLTVTNTNNSDDIVDWLKRIYVQDGTGISNSKPIDITQNYSGYGSWVHGVVGNLLPDLTDTSLAPVNAAFDALDDKFPFSVPNDILRIFQSFESNAVAPVMTFTIPSVLGIGSYSYRIDLSPYDSAMSTIRTMELVAFVTFLLVWARRALTTEAVGADD